MEGKKYGKGINDNGVCGFTMVWRHNVLMALLPENSILLQETDAYILPIRKFFESFTWSKSIKAFTKYSPGPALSSWVGL